MLLQIKQYLTQKTMATTTELALHCRTSPENMQCVLSHWESKGKIKKCPKPNGCGSKCQMCKPEFAQTYRWE